MNFIDHTGHIFSLESYEVKPIGYEFEENKYIFWFDTEYGYKLSVDNYYFKPIRLLLPTTADISDLSVNIKISEGSKFQLMGSKQIQALLAKNDTYTQSIEFTETEFANAIKPELTNDDLTLVNTIKEEMYKGYNIPYYVYYSDEGIKMTYKGDEVIKEDGKKYGFVNFGPLSKKVELSVDYKFVKIEDNTRIKKVAVKHVFISDVTHVDGGVIFNQAADYGLAITAPFPENSYENTFIVNRSRLDMGDVLGDYIIIDVIEIDDETYIVDYVVETVYQTYTMVPFYCVFKSDDEGVWETNLLIHVENQGTDDWCSITVGAECVDETEELIINGKNMGVNLPKQILKAVYQSSFNSAYPDERLYANKLKEYLMNFMQIKGEQGNFRSAINSLKWFGWGDKVSINKLWKTDNEIQTQYLRDSFDINNDTIYTYQCFRNSTLVSLSVPINAEKEETQQDYNSDFWGEGKPEMENLFEKNVVVHYDEGDIDFYRGYFDFVFDELGLKLCALKYYYNKYFLPIHLNIGAASMEYQQHMNDVKLIIKPYTLLTEQPVLTNGGKGSSNYEYKGFTVIFPSDKNLYLSNQTHFIDSNYCEFNNSYELGTKYNEDIYYINDTVVNIPIKFEQEHNEQYYNCKLILVKDNEVVHECEFQFVQKLDDIKSYFKNFVIHPKTLNTVITGNQNAKYDLNYWVESDYVIYLVVNNVWFEYAFNIKFPEVNIHLGKLEYKYYLDTYDRYEDLYGKVNLFKQLNGFGFDENNKEYIKFNSFMFQPDLVDVNNTDFIETLVNYAKTNNLTFINGTDNLAVGKTYFYIEYQSKRYVFSSKSQHVLVSEGNMVTYTVADTEDVKIRRSVNGTYSLLVKHPKDELGNETNPINVYGLLLKTTIYNNLESYINEYYTVSNNFVDNKYLNRCHLIDIYTDVYNEDHEIIGQKMLKYNPNDDDILESIDIDGNKFSFGNNSSAETIELYKTFFDENGDSVIDRTYPYENTYITLNRFGGMYYDLYLMHDMTNWYFIMMSRSTIKNFTENNLKFDFNKTINKITIDEFNGKKEYTLSYDDTVSDEYFLMIDDTANSKKYYLKYNRSDSKILLNRLQFHDSKGINHFDSGDIIACTLVNNDKLPFKLGLGSKWTFTPMSIGMVDESYVESPTEMAVISIGNENSKYSKGYYTVTCNYSFDDFVQHGFEKKGKFRIN